VIPLYSSSLFNFVIILHLLLGVFMMTNRQVFANKLKSNSTDEN
jgi:hypothetical protein